MADLAIILILLIILWELFSIREESREALAEISIILKAILKDAKARTKRSKR